MPDAPGPTIPPAPDATTGSRPLGQRIDWVVAVPGVLLLLAALPGGPGGSVVVGAVVLLFAVALPVVRPKVRTVLRPVVLAILLLQLAAIVLTWVKFR